MSRPASCGRQSIRKPREAKPPRLSTCQKNDCLFFAPAGLSPASPCGPSPGTLWQLHPPLSACPPSLLIFVFRVRAWVGRGGGAAIRESTGGHSAFLCETKRVSATRGGRPAAPPHPMERPAPRGFAKRGAVPGPLPDLRSIGSPYVSEKAKEGKPLSGVDTHFVFPYTHLNQDP